MKKEFELVSRYTPQGDQPTAIAELSAGINRDLKHQILLGVTGSGKTFTMANVIAQVQRPTLVMAPNKTLAAQLYREFKNLFPHNAVEYFISYYDYYQPEAYLPTTDTYIEKDSAINEEIDKMRHSATRSLLDRNDVIIVSSVSCIYGLGSPEAYHQMLAYLEVGREFERQSLLKKLVEIQYERNDHDFHRGTFRVRGDRVEVFPAWEQDRAIRVEFFGDEIESIAEIDPLRGKVLDLIPKITIYPASHYVTPPDKLKIAIGAIQDELRERLQYFKKNNRLVEAQRIEQRTYYDIEMLEEMGYCKGIENYSRHLTGSAAGQPPPTLLDYFPRNFLLFIDESHITVPQIAGMYRGDRARKSNLVDYGFRLPSALDNRPLRFEEFQQRVNQMVYVSATPADFELEQSQGVVVEQVIRPTGLMDPPVEVRPAANQVEDLLGEIRKRIEVDERVLITTLTKRMSEDLTDYYREIGIKVRYLHSDIDSLERVAILKDLRQGVFDVLVGINLLREGLDLPEVSLVAILDADKEGFLRSERSLIQTFGRAARNLHGRVILYADHITHSMQRAMQETERRRQIQQEFNLKHGITPESIKKEIYDLLDSVYEKDYTDLSGIAEKAQSFETVQQLEDHIRDLEKAMRQAAVELEFEKAAQIRDQIRALREQELLLG